MEQLNERPKALDLFCGAGGVSMGLHSAGFDVTGIDFKPQPRYPFRFVQADALKPPLRLSDFDLVWASPVCKRYTRVFNGQEQKRAAHPDQIPPTRQLLVSSGVRLWCIENVIGAPLRPDAVLSGAQFGLDVVRERIFEVSGFKVPFELVPQHSGTVSNGDLACVAGGGANNPWHLRRIYKTWRGLPDDIKARLSAANTVEAWRKAMGIDWMIRKELAQAIPPAYAEFIGLAALRYASP